MEILQAFCLEEAAVPAATTRGKSRDTGGPGPIAKGQAGGH